MVPALSTNEFHACEFHAKGVHFRPLSVCSLSRFITPAAPHLPPRYTRKLNTLISNGNAAHWIAQATETVVPNESSHERCTTRDALSSMFKPRSGLKAQKQMKQAADMSDHATAIAFNERTSLEEKSESELRRAAAHESSNK
jgi:hypothetical protein